MVLLKSVYCFGVGGGVFLEYSYFINCMMHSTLKFVHIECPCYVIKNLLLYANCFITSLISLIFFNSIQGSSYSPSRLPPKPLVVWAYEVRISYFYFKSEFSGEVPP